MKVDIERPNITDNSDILKQIRRYLISLAEKLQWAYDTETVRNKKNIEQLRDCADYVIETGEYGNWKYRKWQSGIVECWGKFTKNDLAISTAVGSSGWYRSQILQDRFPSKLLKEATYVDISPIYWNTITNTNERLVSLSKDHTQWIVMSKTSMTNVNFDYVINAKGTWK